MRDWRSLLLATLLLLGSADSGSAATEAGWSITQTAKGSPMGSGAVILITPTGMRTSNARSGVCLFTRAPSWNIVIYNTQTKAIYQAPLQSWVQSVQKRKSSSGGRFDGATWKHGRDTQIAGMSAHEFVVDKLPAGGRTVKGPDGKLRAMPALSNARLFVANQIQPPKEVSDLISKIYGIPDCQRLPLRVEVTEVGRPPMLAVDTVSVARVNVPDSVFQIPPGLKPVKSDMEVFIDRKSMDELDDLLKDL